MGRKKISQSTETRVLVESRRRCALCFGLDHDASEKPGQIAHIDHDNTNANFGNLAFLCMPHHDRYDSKTSQSKGITGKELTHYRDELYRYTVENNPPTMVENPVDTRPPESAPHSLPPELYKRRLRLYRHVRTYLASIVAAGAANMNDVNGFVNGLDEAIFLFDDDVDRYFYELYKNGVKMHALQFTFQDLPVGDERTKLVAQHTELALWFMEQPRELVRRALPYLRWHY